MVSLAGQPFIDTRLSFHSYLPADLPATVAGKLVDAWVARLRAHPELHDKIEFEVAITTFSFDIDDKLDRLVGDALHADERHLFRDALRRLTLPLLRGEGEGAISAALARVEALAARGLPATDSGLCALLPMIEECSRLGTEPFAVLARHGFIARTVLLSLVARGALSADDVSRFQAGVRTVASDLVDDIFCHPGTTRCRTSPPPEIPFRVKRPCIHRPSSRMHGSARPSMPCCAKKGWRAWIVIVCSPIARPQSPAASTASSCSPVPSAPCWN